MGTIRNLTDRFKLAAANWEEIKQQALIETAHGVIPEMTEQQMRLGETSTGDPIKPDLADVHYALQKQEAGGQAPYKVPDLRVMGTFQAGLRTTIGKLTINTYSIDTKAEKLELKYTPLIYGANPANLAKYAIENLRPALMEKFKAATVG